MNQPSDHELMFRVRDGDTRALGVLFSRHHGRVYSLCYRLTGDASASEDLVQEVFLRLIRYGSGFDGRSKFTTWLYRVTRNRCLDFIDRTARERDRMAELARESQAESPREGEHEILERALQELSPDKREVLVLSRFHGMKYREIAEITGSSVSAIKVRIHRALKELRQIVLQLEGGT